MAAGRRRAVQRELGDPARFVRRAFLLLPGTGQRPVYDDYVISHRVAAARQAPELGFALPRRGQPYPASSLPPQLLALRVGDVAPGRLDALEEALYRAVFVGLLDVADPEVLRRCAREAGVDPDEVDHALGEPDLVDRALAEHHEAMSRGISGIPALLPTGGAPIVGAVPVEVYRDALMRVIA